MTPYTTGINALDEGEWRTAVDEFRGAIEIAQVVGADRLRVYAGSWQPDDRDHAAHWSRLVAALATLAPEASDAGIRLCVENHFGTMTQSAAETARLVREVDHPAVRVLYDQANLTFTHDEPYEQALRIQGDLVGHVHVKDLVFTDPDAPFQASETARVAASERAVRSRVVGDGIVPWGGILAVPVHPRLRRRPHTRVRIPLAPTGPARAGGRLRPIRGSAPRLPRRARPPPRASR